MKKSLVMAMAMAMGVTASAYAANPFSDVPAGHWAYDAVAQLAAAGVVDGYGTTFGGEKLMTRYEMAQIVAKAMAKGSNCDKLAAEFADELDALGVRVAKLEKKVDNVKITGQIRYAYADNRGDEDQYDNGSSLRTRIFVEGNINDNWTYTGMLQNHREITPVSGGDGDAISLKRAYLDGRVGGVKVRAGKWNEFFINDTILDEMIDGVQASYQFGKVNVFGVASKFSGAKAGSWRAKAYEKYPESATVETYRGYDDSDRLYILGAETKFGATKVALNYFKVHGNHTESSANPFNFNDGRDIYSLNVDFPFAKDFNATIRYSFAGKKIELSQDANGAVANDVSKHGWFAQVNYRAADPAKQGTWGLRARYFNQPRNVWLSPTYDCDVFESEKDAFGYKGWNLGVDWAMAKNIMLQVDYYDTRSIEIGSAATGHKARTLFSQLYFFF